MTEAFPPKRVLGLLLSVVIALLGFFYKESFPAPLFLNLMSGLIFGYLMTRANVGFSAGFVEFYNTGNSYQYNSLLLVFAAGMIGTLGVHYGASIEGALPAFLANQGEPTIPGTEVVVPIDLNLMLGTFLFGMGMVLNKGCGSGTLRNIGKGNGRYLLTFVFLLVGTLPGQWVRYAFQKNQIGLLTGEVYLPEVLGYAGTMVGGLITLLILFYLGRLYENHRKQEGTFREVEQVRGAEKNSPDSRYHVMDTNNVYVCFEKYWSRSVGAMGLSVLLIFQLTTTGKTFSLTAPLKKPAVFLFQQVGFGFVHPAYAEPVAAVERGLLFDTDMLFLSGIVLGAFVYALLANSFQLSFNVSKREAPLFMISGFLMGFGAVLANGCNIGTLFSGIVNFSLSGWVALGFTLLGAFSMMHLMNGRIHTIKKEGRSA